MAVAFGLPLFLLSIARDFGLIAPWLASFWAANRGADGGRWRARRGSEHAAATIRPARICSTGCSCCWPRRFGSTAGAISTSTPTARSRPGRRAGALIALGSSAAYLYSVALLVFGIAGHVYFGTAAVIIALILVGKYLEARAKRPDQRGDQGA